MGSVVFDARDVVLGGAAGIGIDPLVDAELGLGFLQRLGRLGVLGGGAAGEEIGLGLGERRERAVHLALLLRFPVEAVGSLDDAALQRCGFGGERFVLRRLGAGLRTRVFPLPR